jgi:hypothetical protein
MLIFLNIFIFCIVLFLYLHIFYHLKTSDDLEIYEIDQPSKEKLEEICDLRQPVVFQYPNERLIELFNKNSVLDTYGAFDIKLRNTSQEVLDDEELYISLPYNNALTIINDDKESKYLIENNNDFLEETGLIKAFKYNDAFIRPYLVANCIYDYNTASLHTKSPFKYDVCYRNYIMVTDGSITVKLAPPKSSKYLYTIYDYENFEFRSPINPWNVQSQYKADFDKIKCMEITIHKGSIIYIPAYWWYSIQFNENNSICCFKYKTYMNTVAILPKLCMSILQRHNVKRQIVKQHNIDNNTNTNTNN